MEHIACPQCGALNDSDAQQCPTCGAALAPAAGEPGVTLSASAADPAISPAALPAIPPAPPPVRQSRATAGLWLLGGLVGLAVLGGLLGGMFLLTRTAGDPLPFLVAPTATPPDPANVLAEADKAMAAVGSYHYVMTATLAGQTAGAAQQEPLQLQGDVRQPDSYTLHSETFGDLIVLGTTAYLQPLQQPQWTQAATADAAPGAVPTNPLLLPRFLHYARNPSLADDVISGTTRLHEVEFAVDVQGLLNGETVPGTATILNASRVRCTVQIGANDHRLYRVHVAVERSLPDEIVVDAILSAFDVPVTLTPPPNVGPR